MDFAALIDVLKMREKFFTRDCSVGMLVYDNGNRHLYFLKNSDERDQCRMSIEEAFKEYPVEITEMCRDIVETIRTELHENEKKLNLVFGDFIVQ